MDPVRHAMNLISAVIKPCRIPPSSNQPLSYRNRPRTQISRTQVIAIGIMSITMIGILATIPLLYSPIPILTPTKYNTESVIVKFSEDGVPLWDLNIRIANATSRILFEPDSIRIIECSNGDYALVSPIYYQRYGNLARGVFLCRLDDFGNIMWERTFEEIDIELGLSLVEVQSGGFAIAGTAQSFHEESNSRIRRVFLMRTEDTGDPRWTRYYTELTGVWSHSLVACDNGDFAIAGTTEIHSDADSNVMLARVDEGGTLLWYTPLGGSLNDEGNSLLECSNGDFIVVGSTQIEDNNKDVLMVRTYANGSIIWNRIYEDIGISVGLSVCSIDNGGFAVTGIWKPSITNPSITLFLLVDSHGEPIIRESISYDAWNRVYGYYDECCGHAIVRANDDGFIIAGTVRYNRWTDKWGMMILRTDNRGKLLCNSTYGGKSWDMACSLVAYEDGGYTVAGVKVSPVG